MKGQLKQNNERLEYHGWCITALDFAHSYKKAEKLTDDQRLLLNTLVKLVEGVRYFDSEMNKAKAELIKAKKDNAELLQINLDLSKDVDNFLNNE